jgi:hypothetical protein
MKRELIEKITKTKEKIDSQKLRKNKNREQRNELDDKIINFTKLN